MPSNSNPLNPVTTFPYKVAPIPQDWLRQFAGFQPIPASNEARTAPDAFHYED